MGKNGHKKCELLRATVDMRPSSWRTFPGTDDQLVKNVILTEETRWDLEHTGAIVIVYPPGEVPSELNQLRSSRGTHAPERI